MRLRLTLLLLTVAFRSSCIKDGEMVPRYVVKVELAALAGAERGGRGGGQADRDKGRTCISPRESDLMAQTYNSNYSGG